MGMKGLFQSAYGGATALVTGHTGFKGAWLSIWLKSLGARVSGLALDPKNDKDIFVLSGIGQNMQDHRGDIRNLEKVLSDNSSGVDYPAAPT